MKDTVTIESHRLVGSTVYSARFVRSYPCKLAGRGASPQAALANLYLAQSHRDSLQAVKDKETNRALDAAQEIKDAWAGDVDKPYLEDN